MGWATTHIERLKEGQVVSFRPMGNSMVPRIRSGDLVTVAPPYGKAIGVGDVVLCKVNGRQFLHLVSALRGEQFQISNNHGFVNGWIGRNGIYGVLVA